MTYTPNIKSLTLFFSKFLFYIFIPISLMGMLNPADPPGPDLYNQTYDTLTLRYNALNGATNQGLNGYNIELRNSFMAMRDCVNQTYDWAHHHGQLAEIDFDKAKLLYDRVVSILGRIATFAASAQTRVAAVQSNVQGAAVLPGDQPILDALNQANNIRQQAKNALDQAQAAANRAQAAVRNARNRRDAARRTVRQLNQQIFNNVNYTGANVTNCNTMFTNVKNNITDANGFARTAKDAAIEIRNEVNNLDQYMVNIRLQGTNINIQLP
ncbi:MAG: hypothetical protein NMK33_00090 [Candidatus Cardinium sp.]|uniref:hypothetical protein n=1 Tax=Cardinium endosymbiont of Dermatophagoides farinae TaxID=2597823 RepID=UPI001183DE05|nr:hypothetical protein [Cardinium endosymbiont of Dermatophagoides farinae]TSJ80941.1 hypothetical protein FPG78_02770 [Cardinium endosymbiont of Dermatophagoides farinae]UWW96963.1 MAG: hypothetical protein NMK33_00090 [Candidatus Cardinium sp.]